MTRQPLGSDRRGAMFMMGIPICFFMIGLLYFVIGLGEDIVLRERMQDAADATALSAAVMHARGMNLIAMLNQVMAALVGLLIMTKLLEAILIAAMALATALAWPTAGASLSVIPTAETGREEAANAYDALKAVVDPIVMAIHYLEVGIQYGMPVIAEARAVEVSLDYKPVALIGIAIPGDFPLPLKNGTWKQLCDKASDSAAEMVTFPLALLIPVDAVLDVVKGALSGLTSTFSSYFCNPDAGLEFPTELPPIKLNPKDPVRKNLPPFESTKACTNEPSDQAPQFETGPGGLPVAQGDQQQREADNQQRIDDRSKICEASARELMQAKQDPGTGGPNSQCNYNWGQQKDLSCDPCVSGNDVCAQFSLKTDGAPEACKDAKNVKKWYYQRRDLKWQATLTPLGKCDDPQTCRYSVTFSEPAPVGEDHYAETDNPPCGGKGEIGPEYNTGATFRADGKYTTSDYLCVQAHSEPDPSQFTGSASGYTMDEISREFSGWASEQTADGYVLTGEWSAVTFLHSCDQQIDDMSQSQEYSDQAKIANERHDVALEAQPQQSGQGGGCQGQNKQDEVHLEMEDADEDNMLGGSIYQMRSIVLRDMGQSNAKSVVESIPLRLRGTSDEANPNPLGAAGDVLNSIFAAQAEYYFDTEWEAHGDRPDQTKAARSEWAWNIAWRARMRRLRFNDDSASKSSCGDQWSTKGARQEKKKDQKQGGGGQSQCDQQQGMSAMGGDESALDAKTLIGTLPLQGGQGDAVQGLVGGKGLGGGSSSGGGQSQQQQGGAKGGSGNCGSVDTLSNAESLIVH